LIPVLRRAIGERTFILAFPIYLEAYDPMLELMAVDPLFRTPPRIGCNAGELELFNILL